MNLTSEEIRKAWFRASEVYDADPRPILKRPPMMEYHAREIERFLKGEYERQLNDQSGASRPIQE